MSRQHRPPKIQTTGLYVVLVRGVLGDERRIYLQTLHSKQLSPMSAKMGAEQQLLHVLSASRLQGGDR